MSLSKPISSAGPLVRLSTLAVMKDAPDVVSHGEGSACTTEESRASEDRVALICKQQRMRQICRFLETFSINHLVELIMLMNHKEYDFERYCNCNDCHNLNPETTGAGKHSQCILYPHFKMLCAQRDIKLLEMKQVGTEGKPVARTYQKCGSLVYEEDAHLVIVRPGAWSSLGYGTKVAEPEGLKCGWISDMRSLFYDMERYFPNNKEVPVEATADESQKSADGVTADESKKSAEEATADESQKSADGVTTDESQKSAEEATADESKESPEEATADESREGPEEATADESKESPEEVTADESKESPEEATKDGDEAGTAGLF